MQPTDEQSEIVDIAKCGESGVVEALAGTGKSTTLRMISMEMAARRGLLVVFNRSVADEAKAKVNEIIAAVELSPIWLMASVPSC